MARRVITTVVMTDDLTGTDIPEDQAESLTFALEGATFEIDLSKENAEQLRTAMEPFMNAGRRVKTAVTVPSRGGYRSLPHGERKARTERLRQIREFARSQGIDQPMTGKVKVEAFDVWDAAHPNDLAERPD